MYKMHKTIFGLGLYFSIYGLIQFSNPENIWSGIGFLILSFLTGLIIGFLSDVLGSLTSTETKWLKHMEE